MFLDSQNTLIFLILLLNTSSKQNSPEEIWDRLQSDSQISHGIKYPFESHEIRYMWHLTGTAMFLNNKLSLTSNEKGQKGGIWSIIPNQAHYWAVDLEFKIHNDNAPMFGDGMALWYVSNFSLSGNAFGNDPLFYGLGIFFDTFNNRGDSTNEYPFVSASVDNLTTPYDHHTDGITTAIGGCANNFRNKRLASHALIIYHDNKLSVYIKDPKSSRYTSDGLIECFSVDEVFLPAGLHFGVTAATGDLTDNHDLISLRIIELEDEKNADELGIFDIVPHVSSNVNVEFDSKDKVTRGFSIALIVIALIAALIGLIVYLVSGGSSRDKLF